MTGQPQLECPIPVTTVLNIDMTDLQVTDTGGTPSNLIIDAGASFKVSATFLIGGTSTAGFKLTGAPFTVDYYYEGYGSAPEGALGTVGGNSGMGVNSATCAGAQEYSGPAVTELTVPPLTLTPGLYKLSAMVNFGPWALFGFVDGPVIQQL